MKIRILLFLIILLAGTLTASYLIKNKTESQNSLKYREKIDNTLKVINPIDINPDLVDSTIQLRRVGHKISDFAFINQYNDTITQTDLDKKIYVANYFFTTCGSICPVMNKQMKRVQTEFQSDSWLMLLSHTVWPEGDSVERLYDYSVSYEAIPDKWWFLTGSKSALYTMARKSYLVVPDENDPKYDHGNESDFIHTENFVLVDPEKKIRGMYDGTNSDEISELIKDIYDLKREYKY